MCGQRGNHLVQETEVEGKDWRSHQDLVTDSWVCSSRNCSCDGSAKDDGEGHLRRDNSNWQF